MRRNSRICNIHIREKGTEEHPALTLEIESPFDERFVEKIKSLIPYGARVWDADSSVWRAHPDFQRQVQQICLDSYDHVYLCEGAKTTALHSGQVTVQEGLF